MMLCRYGTTTTKPTTRTGHYSA